MLGEIDGTILEGVAGAILDFRVPGGGIETVAAAGLAAAAGATEARVGRGATPLLDVLDDLPLLVAVLALLLPVFALAAAGAPGR